MKNLKDMLITMSDRAIDKLATDLWESYEDDGEYGIATYLDVDYKEVIKMLDCTTLDEFEDSMDLADALRVYKADGSEEAYLRAELRRLKAREAKIKERLKALAEENKEEEPEVLNPYKVFREEGEEGLQKKLEGLDIESLRRIVKMNRFDMARRSGRWSEDKLMHLIVTMTKTRATRGDVFRSYKG